VYISFLKRIRKSETKINLLFIIFDVVAGGCYFSGFSLFCKNGMEIYGLINEFIVLASLVLNLFP
jgi:hypothetical protein